MAKRTTSRPPSEADDSAAPAPPRRTRRARATDSESATHESVTDAVAVSDEPTGMDRPNEEDIRLRAYHRYLERGGGHGMDFEDWLEAERELKGRK